MTMPRKKGKPPEPIKELKWGDFLDALEKHQDILGCSSLYAAQMLWGTLTQPPVEDRFIDMAGRVFAQCARIYGDGDELQEYTARELEDMGRLLQNEFQKLEKKPG